MLLVFKASSVKCAYFWSLLLNICVRIKSTNKKFACIELTSFKSFDSKVPSFKFGTLLWTNAHKFLAKALVNLSMPKTALEQEVIAAAITIALILYLHASDVHQHSTFNRSWTATLLWGTDIWSRPSKTFAHIRSGSRYINFLSN